MGSRLCLEILHFEVRLNAAFAGTLQNGFIELCRQASLFPIMNSYSDIAAFVMDIQWSVQWLNCL